MSNLDETLFPNISNPIDELTKVTQMLCGLLQYVEDNDYCADMHGACKEIPNLEEFWAKHKEIDEKRLQAEADKALKKLTPADIAILKRKGIMR